MIILGYSGLDNALEYKMSTPDVRSGEERIVQGLDSAAALLKDGKIIAASAEERFTYNKQTGDFPINAIQYCLREAEIDIKSVNVIAHGFDYQTNAYVFKMFNSDYYEKILSIENQKRLWKKEFGISLSDRHFMSVDHHEAHAATASFCSGFDKSLCLVFDGMGELYSLSLYRIMDRRIKRLATANIGDSLGILYSIITMHLGFKFNSDEYKVMGLAAYGNPERYHSFFSSLIGLKEKGGYKINWKKIGVDEDMNHRHELKYLHEKIIPRRQEQEEIQQRHMDFAAAAQDILEKTTLHILRYWKKETGLDNLCMAGGVALNCCNNRRIIESNLFKNVYVQPASGDDGTALGAALVASNLHNYPLDQSQVQEMPFYGPSYSEVNISQCLEAFKDKVKYEKFSNMSLTCEDAAEQVNQDKIIGWFQGRMEYGPRALGNRSILANPTMRNIKDRLNKIIKKREGFRPFAPAVLMEKAQMYFDIPYSAPLEYMLSTCNVKPEFQNVLHGITHFNHSARVQTVAQKKAPLFYELIECFGKLSNVYCLVNTSFNVKDQPIVISPQVALETFCSIDLDVLYMGNYKITKC